MLSLAVASAVCRAEYPETSLPSEGDFLDEIPVVLSVTRLDQPIAETPAAITVIDREMIEARGARDIPELFRLVPGMQVGTVSGSIHTVTYHGLSDLYSRRMQVLVDGRSIYTPAMGGMRWSDLPLDISNIERIEVIRGPNAAAYGANSFLGVISITTHHPSQTPGTLVQAKVGNDDIRDGTLRHAGNLGDLDYRVTLGYRHDVGLDERHDSKQVRMATLRANYHPGAKDELELQMGYNEGPREDGFPGDPAQPKRRVRVGSHFQKLHWTHAWSGTNESKLQFYHNYHNNREIRGGFGTLEQEADHRAERFDLEFQHITGAKDASYRLVFGASARQDQVRSRLFYSEGRNLENEVYRLFANLEWRITPKLIMNAGAMVEKNDIAGVDTSPRLAFNYQLFPGQTIRIAGSKATRTAVMLEDQADFRSRIPTGFSPPLPAVITGQVLLGPETLDPEKISSLEFGYHGEFPQAHLSLDLRLFRDHLRELIDLVDRPGSKLLTGDAFVNRNRADIHGAELQADWRPISAARLMFGYSNTNVHGNTQQVERSTPTHTLSLLWIYRFPWQLTASAAYYYISRQTWLLENNSEVPAIQRLDLRLAKDFRFNGSKLHIAGVVQNLLGDYEDFYANPTKVGERNVFDTRTLLTLGLEF